MENSEINQEKRNEGKGCLLTGVLLSSVIGALLMAFFYGLSAIVNATTSPVNVAFLLRSSFLFAVSLYSFYAIFQTYKMRKKGAYGLLGVYVVGILSFLLIAFEKTPDSPEAKAGVVYSILFAIINVVYAVILLMNLKKMK